ncbi:MAG: hypothetical protein P8O16_03520 [Algoriphagus sp.]|uniref:hypothetical protein n=1 Tax=Algoriphagus sp. TaxID=1872435 RepID=UPI00260E4FE4|nr:hypothetical protein [Algoriphagus sp.]MDG1276323.1 hypothetical protein [Algoriphagus sp.]
MTRNYDSFSMGLILCFEDAFPNEKMLAAEEYLAEISTEFLIKASSFLLTYNVNREKLEDPKSFLDIFFSEENNAFKENILQHMIEMRKRARKPVGVFHEYSGLRVIEIALGAVRIEGAYDNGKLERDLFKSLLVLNTEFSNRQMKAIETTNDIDQKIRIQILTFTAHYAVFDKSNYKLEKIWMAQVIKAFLFFEFLESYENTKPLLNEFCKYYEVKDWREYLESLLPITQNVINRAVEGNTDLIVSKDDSYDKNVKFLEKLIVTPYDSTNESDFLTLRSKPILKTSEGKYRIIFDIFATELIFKGLYFKLREINDLLEKNRIPDLKGMYGLEFSEKILLYKSIESIYPKAIQYSGKQIDDMGINSAPDYYLRIGNKVLLFESKDFLIRADKKFSFDYNVYDEEFGKTLDFEEKANGSLKNGAVLQLIKNVTRVLRKDFPFDKGINQKEVKVYPILVLHDLQYEVLGFKDFVDQWYNQELLILKEEGFNVNRIQPLTIVNIDSLLLYQKVLETTKPLSDFIDDFHRFNMSKIHSEDDFYRKMRPFGYFLEEQIRIKGIGKKPDIFSKIVDQILTTSAS